MSQKKNKCIYDYMEPEMAIAAREYYKRLHDNMPQNAWTKSGAAAYQRTRRQVKVGFREYERLMRREEYHALTPEQRRIRNFKYSKSSKRKHDGD